MTVDDLLRRGEGRERAGDMDAPEKADGEADELCDAEGAIRLGLLLQRRGNLRGAADAFRRAEARGHIEAASCLGGLLWDDGDLEAAKAAYQHPAAAGSAVAALNRGLAFARQGAVDEALPQLRTTEAQGLVKASWAIGKVLESRGDLRAPRPRTVAQPEPGTLTLRTASVRC